eukprot:20088-Heterococcus_DN1.PRE.1
MALPASAQQVRSKSETHNTHVSCVMRWMHQALTEQHIAVISLNRLYCAPTTLAIGAAAAWPGGGSQHLRYLHELIARRATATVQSAAQSTTEVTMLIDIARLHCIAHLFAQLAAEVFITELAAKLMQDMAVYQCNCVQPPR